MPVSTSQVFTSSAVITQPIKAIDHVNAILHFEDVRIRGLIEGFTDATVSGFAKVEIGLTRDIRFMGITELHEVEIGEVRNARTGHLIPILKPVQKMLADKASELISAGNYRLVALAVDWIDDRYEESEEFDGLVDEWK